MRATSSRGPRIAASIWLTIALAVAATSVATRSSAGTDHFPGGRLSADWAVHSTGQAEYAVRDGRLVVEVPERHSLWPLPGDNMDAPMFLLDPPPDAATVSLETRLSFAAGAETSVGAQAGLVIVRRDMQALALLLAARGWSALMAEWADAEINTAIGGGGAAAFGAGEDLWMRFEHRGDDFAVFHKDAEQEPWTDVTSSMNGSFPNLVHRFEPGSYLVGLFVANGMVPVDTVEVAFDYFHSPELDLRDIAPVGRLTTTWAELRSPAP